MKRLNHRIESILRNTEGELKMKNNNRHFINTTDPGTAETLRQLGFKELPKSGDRWVFINEKDKISFSSDNLKMNYTDKLTF